MLARALLMVTALVVSSGVALAQAEAVPAADPISAAAAVAPVFHSGVGSIQPDGSLNGSVAVVGKSGALEFQAGALVSILQNGKSLKLG